MTDNPKKLTKTDAKEVYCLNDKDLVGVPHQTVSLSGCKYMCANLYEVADIEAVALKKYGSFHGIDDAIAERKRRAEKRAANKLIKIQQDALIKETRRDDLDKYLKQLGLQGIRSDSSLCALYIEKGKKSGYTMEKIGEIIQECSFLYNHTDYQDILDTVIESEKEYKGRYDIDECKYLATYRAVLDYAKKHKPANSNDTQDTMDDWKNAFAKIPATYISRFNIKF